MSKGIYSARDFQGYFATRSDEDFEGDELVVGIDVAKRAFYAALAQQRCEEFDVVYFERQQIREFIARLVELDVDQVTLVVEPTGTYSDGLVEEARRADLKVVRINGARVADGRKVFDNTDSLHDGKAAHLLAHLYLCGVGQPWEQATDSERQIRGLADLDELIRDDIDRYRGPLEAAVSRHWPELTDVLELDSATLLELLGQFGGPGRVAERPDRARRLIEEVGRGAVAEAKIEAIIESASTTIGREMTEAEVRKVKYIATMLRSAQQEARDFDRTIEQQAEAHEETQNLVEFAGARTAVVLVGLLGELGDYDDWQSLEKAAGLDLCEHSSGKTARQKREESSNLRISKRGPGRVRKMLFWLALRVLNPVNSSYCPIARAWYEERLARNGGNSMKAIVAVMHKLIRALWWIGRGRAYDGTKLFDVQRLKNRGRL